MKTILIMILLTLGLQADWQYADGYENDPQRDCFYQKKESFNLGRWINCERNRTNEYYKKEMEKFKCVITRYELYRPVDKELAKYNYNVKIQFIVECKLPGSPFAKPSKINGSDKFYKEQFISPSFCEFSHMENGQPMMKCEAILFPQNMRFYKSYN